MTLKILTKDIAAVLALVALSLNLTACQEQKTEVKTVQTTDASCAPNQFDLNDEQVKLMHLTTIKTQTRTMPVNLYIPAVVQANPIMTTPVNSLVPGRVEDVLVQPGDQVKRGQLLVTVRSDEVGQIESDLLSKVMQDDAERKQVQVKMQLAQKVYERRKTLMEEKIAARADLEVAENELEQEKASLQAILDKHDANIDATVQRLKLFGIERREVERVIKTKEIHHLFEIKAPRSGVITTRDADPGEMIEAGKPLFVVADLSQVYLTAQLPEKDVSAVRHGMPVSATIDSYPGKAFSGTLNFISSNIEPETRTLPVKAKIENAQFLLKPEMFGDLTIETARITSLFIPAKCVQQIGESSVVYVLKQGKTFNETQVETGKIVGEYVEIKSGLHDGDIVAEEGSLKLLGMALQRLSK